MGIRIYSFPFEIQKTFETFTILEFQVLFTASCFFHIFSSPSPVVSYIQGNWAQSLTVGNQWAESLHWNLLVIVERDKNGQRCLCSSSNCAFTLEARLEKANWHLTPVHIWRLIPRITKTATSSRGSRPKYARRHSWMQSLNIALKLVKLKTHMHILFCVILALFQENWMQNECLRTIASGWVQGKVSVTFINMPNIWCYQIVQQITNVSWNLVAFDLILKIFCTSKILTFLPNS